MVKIIFFQPHPDDLDIYCLHLLFHLTNQSKYSFEIKIASMTRGEEGVTRKYKGFKGKRISKIRTLEFYKALRIYRIPTKQIHFFSMIDSNIRFSRNSIELVRNYLEKEKPDIIFAPEPRFSYYLRQDHVITGEILYYICDKMLIEKLPKLYFYAPINPNYYQPFETKGFLLVKKIINIYKSQYTTFQRYFSIHRFIGLFYGKKLKGWKYAEGYRRVFFFNEKYKNKKLNFFQRLFQIINFRLSIPISLSLLIGIILNV